MQAIILGAGLGTRLHPITESIPKVLVPVFGKPLLEYAIRYLYGQGVRQVALNTHHHASAVRAYVDSRGGKEPCSIRVNFEPRILGTGGGIKGLEHFIGGEDCIVYNTDVVTDIALAPVLKAHRKSGALVTMVLHDYPGLNQVYVDKSGAICDFRNLAGRGREAVRMLAFTGISIINRRLFNYLPAGEPADIISLYVQLLRERKEQIGAWISKGAYWRDTGTPKELWALHQDVLSKKMRVLKGFSIPETGVYTAAGSDIGATVRLEPFTSVGRGCLLQNGVYRNCVIMPGTERYDLMGASDCIIGPGYSLPIE